MKIVCIEYPNIIKWESAADIYNADTGRYITTISGGKDKYAVEEMSDNRRWIDAIDDNAELSELFDELENEDDENDESVEG